MSYAWEREGWADSLVITPSVKRSEPVQPLAGSLWVSVCTKRRGAVLWASSTHVELSFTDHARKLYTMEQFKRLFKPTN